MHKEIRKIKSKEKAVVKDLGKLEKKDLKQDKKMDKMKKGKC